MTTLLNELTPLFDRGFFENLFEDTTHNKSAVRFPRSRYPMDYSVNPDKGSHTISYALAGFSKEDINIEIHNDTLKITAKHDGSKVKAKPGQALHRGISYTNLDVEWKIPKNLDIDNISVSFENCILNLDIPVIQKEERKKKIISIN